MLIVYRCSDKGNVRERPDWISLFGCLRNLLEGVTDEDTLVVLCDNCEDATFESVRDIVGGSGVRQELRRTALGNSGSFLEILADLDGRAGVEDVQFVEDDQWHRPGALGVLRRALAAEGRYGKTFLTLQDHPDCQDPRVNTAYPALAPQQCQQRDIVRQVADHHWRAASSTTMTFAGKRHSFMQAAGIMEKQLTGRIPKDQEMWCDLHREGQRLQSAIPGLATHGESRYLSPGVDWAETVSVPVNLSTQARAALQSPEIFFGAEESTVIERVASGSGRIAMVLKEWSHNTRAMVAQLVAVARPALVRIVFEEVVAASHPDVAEFVRITAAEGIHVSVSTGDMVPEDEYDLFLQNGSEYGKRLEGVLGKVRAGTVVVAGTGVWGEKNWDLDEERVMVDRGRFGISLEDAGVTMMDVLRAAGAGSAGAIESKGVQGITVLSRAHE